MTEGVRNMRINQLTHCKKNHSHCTDHIAGDEICKACLEWKLKIICSLLEVEDTDD
jgi:hypothetical protein